MKFLVNESCRVALIFRYRNVKFTIRSLPTTATVTVYAYVCLVTGSVSVLSARSLTSGDEMLLRKEEQRWTVVRRRPKNTRVTDRRVRLFKIFTTLGKESGLAKVRVRGVYSYGKQRVVSKVKLSFH